MTESLQRKLENLKAQLGGSNPIPLERLVIERVVSCWLQLQHIDVLVAQARPGTVQAKFLLQRQAQADRAYNTAVKSLTTVRQLMPNSAEPRARADNRANEIRDPKAGTVEAAILPLDPRERRRA